MRGEGEKWSAGQHMTHSHWLATPIAGPLLGRAGEGEFSVIETIVQRTQRNTWERVRIVHQGLLQDGALFRDSGLGASLYG